MLIAAGVLLLCLVPMVWFQPDIYKATVRILVPKDPTQTSSLRGHSSGLLSEPIRRTFEPVPSQKAIFAFGNVSPFWVQEQFETILSKLILYQVITNLNLNHQWAQKMKRPVDLRTEETYRLLKQRLEVRQTRNSELIEINVFDEDPQEAPQIANQIARVFQAASDNQRTESMLRKIKPWEEQWKQNALAITNKVKEVKALKHVTVTAASAGLKLQASNASPSATEQSAYEKAQQNLDAMQAAQEKLALQIIGEQVESAMGRSGIEVIDKAEPSSRPFYSKTPPLVALFAGGIVCVLLGSALRRAGLKATSSSINGI